MPHESAEGERKNSRNAAIQSLHEVEGNGHLARVKKSAKKKNRPSGLETTQNTKKNGARDRQAAQTGHKEERKKKCEKKGKKSKKIERSAQPRKGAEETAPKQA
jgi:hypothetical protein